MPKDIKYDSYTLATCATSIAASNEFFLSFWYYFSSLKTLKARSMAYKKSPLVYCSNVKPLPF
jgi:hypothetical protein